MARHRPVAVVDLAFFSRGGHDHRVGFARRLTAQLPDEAPDARIAGGEAVVVDEVLPDRHRRPPLAHEGFDPLAVGLAGAGLRAATRRRRRVGGRLYGRFCRGRVHRVGGHLYGRFRLGGWVPPATRRSHRDPGGGQIATRRLATDAGGFLDAPQRPPEPPQRQHLLSLLVAQDVCHARGRPCPPLRVNIRASVPMAGFQVSIYR